VVKRLDEKGKSNNIYSLMYGIHTNFASFWNGSLGDYINMILPLTENIKVKLK
jgi:hypothetical protein